MATKKWVQKATANAHGQFRAKAQKKGMSTMDYAQSVLKAGSSADTTTKRQANLAITLMGMSHRKKKP